MNVRRTRAYYAAGKRDRMRRSFSDYFRVDIPWHLFIKKPTNQILPYAKKIIKTSTRWPFAYVLIYKTTNKKTINPSNLLLFQQNVIYIKI